MDKNINISKATKNNWIRLNVTESEIEEKLSKRANKQCSKKNIIPIEYFNNKNNIFVINNILLYVKDKKYDIETSIYNFVLNRLQSNSLIEFDNDKVLSKNKYILGILNKYDNLVIDKYLVNFNLPNDEKDILGIIYQLLMQEGSKNKKGSYYTPDNIIQKITKNIKGNETILDPCCGTGSFLLSFANKISNPNNIYGFDNDEIACFIAKINLILKYKNQKFMPNIFQKNFLLDTNDFDKKFDIIATNPPWGALSKKEYKTKYSEIKSDESFSYFVIQSEKMLKENGKCLFILPESILNVGVHSDIRKFILNHFYIDKIELLGKVFSGVLTDILLLDLSKINMNKPIEIITKTKKLELNNNYYKQNKNYNFSILDNKDVKLLEQIYSISYKTLEKSKWVLGIVTGNNSKHIITNAISGEKIYTGKDIAPYILKDTDKYIVYERSKFQQTAPDEIYRADEKLVYKFISKKLVFAYDNKQQLFLNSANILIPKVETHSIKTVLAFLNSTIFQYIYKKKFNELKILKGNLLQLPFPVLDKNIKNNLEKLVDNYIKNQNISLKQIDEIIFDCFYINDLDKNYIISSIK